MDGVNVFIALGMAFIGGMVGGYLGNLYQDWRRYPQMQRRQEVWDRRDLEQR